MPKGCLVLPNIVSPLREKPVLFPDLEFLSLLPAEPSLTPHPSPHPLPGRGAGGSEVEDFPDSNCKASHFDFPLREEQPGLCFPWL